MFGLIGVTIPASIIIQRECHVTLAILTNEGKIVRHVEECRGGVFYIGTSAGVTFSAAA